jgi:carboxypeptidase C (cathepsin A)
MNKLLRDSAGMGALALLLIFGQAATGTVTSAAQEPEKPADAKSDAKPADAKTPDGAVNVAPKEESSVTDHTIHIGGQTIAYKATASTTLLKNSKDEPTALMYSTAYTRSDVKDFSQRPIAFIYNGGPGSASVWLHMGAFGPRRVVTENAASTPPAPYQIVDNTESLLDKADMVFIDPVGTGFSHAVGKAQDKDFWGVDQDVRSLAQFIYTYLSRNNRWNSPKFLIGESYGTFRSVALANYLQGTDGIYINGIVLISSVIDAGTLSFVPGDDRSYIFYLPSYAAAAWHYKVLQNPPADLAAFVESARQFASTEYAAALMKGSKLTAAETADIAKKLSAFIGLSEDYLIKAQLRVALPQFSAELQRSRGLTLGRYDARYSGPTYDLLTEGAEFDPSYSAVHGAFTAAMNSYVRDELKFGQDKIYNILPNGPSQNWDWKHNAAPGEEFPSAPNVGGDLVRELIDNPRLQIQAENGYFDMATPFFATEYTMDHLALPADSRARIHLQYYDSGHMIYLHDEDRVKLKNNIAGFIDSAVKQ